MLRIKSKGNPESIPLQLLQPQIENQIRIGWPLAPGPLHSTGYFNSIKNPSNPKKRFVKNPLFPTAFGQNKTLKLPQNNVVINTQTAIRNSRYRSTEEN